MAGKAQVPQARTMMAQPSQAMGPKEFQYSYDFDENGALFYLGSSGRRRVWQNPHILGQVEAFCSCIASGSAENFVGRSLSNCRTIDEPASFFGVDLGLDRKLLPTYYTLRNRGSSTYVLLTWQFEGSNDKEAWTVLDARNYQSTNPDDNERLQREIEQFKQRGGAMTFSVDLDQYKQGLGFGGYRYFRIVQTSKNSGSSNSLCLSGFELYGRVQSGRWP